MEANPNQGFMVIHSPQEIEAKQRLPYFVGVSGKNAGATGISMNLVVIPPGGAAEAHSHSGFESAVYMIKGRALCKYGDGLANSSVVEAGDFLFIGPNVWHQPVNLSDAEEVVAVVARNDPDEQEHVILLDAP